MTANDIIVLFIVSPVAVFTTGKLFRKKTQLSEGNLFHHWYDWLAVKYRIQYHGDLEQGVGNVKLPNWHVYPMCTVVNREAVIL